MTEDTNRLFPCSVWVTLCVFKPHSPISSLHKTKTCRSVFSPFVSQRYAAHRTAHIDNRHPPWIPVKRGSVFRGGMWSFWNGLAGRKKQCTHMPFSPDNRTQNEEASTSFIPLVRNKKGWWIEIVYVFSLLQHTSVGRFFTTCGLVVSIQLFGEGHNLNPTFCCGSYV